VVDNSITQLRSEEWWGTRPVVGSDAMPASAEMRAHDAQYDNPLRGALLHTEGQPVAGIRTAGEEIIRGSGQAGRPEHGASVVPGIVASFRIHGHFLRFHGHFYVFSLTCVFSRIRGQRLARKPATAPTDWPGWPASATFRSPSRPGTEERRATKEGNKR
jgi:hypothetical protein